MHKSDILNTLQSPVETHFALTPVASSENSSPANGFTGEVCTELLKEELDQLEKDALKLNLKEKQEILNNVTISFDNLVSPTEENINMFSRCNSGILPIENEPIGDVNSDKNHYPRGEVSFIFLTCLFFPLNNLLVFTVIALFNLTIY